MVRVLIVDDSSTMRNALAGLVASERELQVVGQAATGGEAIALAARLRPDVITIELNLPDRDGVETIREIMTEAPARIVVVCAVSAEKRQELAARALAAGALELIAKPAAADRGDLTAWGRKVNESIRLMAKVPVIRRSRRAHLTPDAPASPPPPRAATPASPRAMNDAHPRVGAFGIASSTGGPNALRDLLAALPADLPFPILIAQHMTPGFTAGLVTLLGQFTPLKVMVGDNGMPCGAGVVYLPPDAHDLSLATPGVLRVEPSCGIHVPSCNRLLSSLAACYGARAGGAVLTGMGEDGVEGLLAIKQAGGFSYAQDQQSSVVFGMPRVAFERGAAAVLLSPVAIAAAICGLALRR